MCEIDVLKWEVLKKYPQRLRYLALYEMYTTLFHGMLDKDYYFKQNNATPEEDYLKVYDVWKAVPDDKVWDKVVSIWDEDYVKEFMYEDNRPTDIIVQDVEDFVRSIKK